MFSIIHCLRAPVGGLFRHVCELAAEQAGMGHSVGVVCDAADAGKAAEATLRNLAENCALGVARIPMSRQIGLRDITAYRHVSRLAREKQADVLHGHGAKGGAYARLAAATLKKKGQKICSFYTPHDGSLHYDPSSLQGRIFTGLERRLGPKTDGLIFESVYSSKLYSDNVGPFPCEARVVYNGLKPQEFYDVILDENACEFVFVGELRWLKGVDVFLNALSEVLKTQAARAFIAGGGPDEKKFRALAHKMKLDNAVTFAGPVPAHMAFARGRCLVIPSRAESLPYIVLEAAAAQLPFIATAVGGIPEIVEGSQVRLIPPDNAVSLAHEMAAFLHDPGPRTDAAIGLQRIVSRKFNVSDMARTVTHFYSSRLFDRAGA